MVYFILVVYKILGLRVIGFGNIVLDGFEKLDKYGGVVV